MALFRDNPVIIVTGADGGIGTTIVQRLEELGATVVGCDMDRPAPYNFDVRQRSGWQAVFAQVIADHGRVDVLINNAGVQTQGADTVADLDDDEWHRVMDINVNAVRIGMSEAVKHFGDDGGRIINTDSVSGYRHFPGACVYSTSKAAALALTRQAALDYSGKGIRINAVAPGMMENTMSGGKASDFRDKVIASSLTGEPVKKVEIAAAVEFLLDARNESMVGACIEIDGGFGLPKGAG
ncbi:MAG: SDR family NAD(P)-dependent oxidoreductase [Desertimonas sp.]